MYKTIKITERGWPGHFICAMSCTFRRNTLIEYGDIKIVVSTVGNMRRQEGLKEVADTVGLGRYYETMAFHAEYDGYYWDVNVGCGVEFESEWAIDKIYDNADNDANEMHEVVVKEIVEKLRSGNLEGTKPKCKKQPTTIEEDMIACLTAE